MHYQHQVWANQNWSPADIVVDPSEFNTSAKPDSSGFISLVMTFDECAQTDSFYVEVHTKAEIEAVGDSICVGETGILHAQGKADNLQMDFRSGSDCFQCRPRS